MILIESVHNELIKKYAKLLQKKFRDESGLYIIEGNKNAFDSLKNLRSNEIESVLICSELKESFLNDFALLEDRVIVTTKSVLKKVSEYSSDSQIIVIARQRDYRDAIDSDFCVYLDRIRDPGNLGTIIRTAAAAGYGIIMDNCCDLFNPKVVRACMSAISSIKICYGDFTRLCEYKDKGYKIVSAAASGDSIFELQSYKAQKIIIAIGNEAEGLPMQIIATSDKTAAIPIESIESLNAAVAAGILMFEFKHRILK